MTQHEVFSAILAQIPPTKRPAYITDREVVEMFLSLRRGVKAKREGGPMLSVTLKDLEAKYLELGGEL